MNLHYTLFIFIIKKFFMKQGPTVGASLVLYQSWYQLVEQLPLVQEVPGWISGPTLYLFSFLLPFY